MLKPKKTTRKFYNKWMYKVTLSIPGVSVLRLFKLEDVSSKIQETNIKNTYSTLAKAVNNREKITSLADFLLSFDQKTWAKRIEKNEIDLYTNDLQFYNRLKSEFIDLTVHAFEPEDPALLESTSSVVVKRLPHGKFKFKVFLLPHKIKDVSDKHQYLEWIKGQGDKVLISEAVKTWFINTAWNWDRRYIMVEDEHTLLMLKLRNAEVVGSIQDYVLDDK
jgi:hypothetical protein